MNPPHVKKMCQNKPWTDKTGQFPHCDCTLEVPCLLYANGFPVPRRDLNLGRPEHIKRTCDGSIPSNARIRFMLLENSDRKIAVLEKSTSNKMSNKIRGATSCLCEYMSNSFFRRSCPPEDALAQTFGRPRLRGLLATEHPLSPRGVRVLRLLVVRFIKPSQV